jgi:putative flippase GtrA
VSEARWYSWSGAIVEVRSLTRFIVVGFSNTAINFVVFWLVSRALPPTTWRYAAAQVAAYVPSMAWSYFWNRRWAFSVHAPQDGSVSRFVAVQITFALLSAYGIQLMVDTTHLPPNLCWLVVMSVTTLSNYLTLRRWVFRPAADAGVS